MAYKWIALSNTTLGILLATVNQSIVIISLPAIFRGIHLDPLRPGNVSYLLWMLMGYLVVSAVLVVAFGRLGDIYGRVRMYNAGFLIFTLASIALAFTPDVGSAGALELIGLRIVQGSAAPCSWPTPWPSSPTPSRCASAAWPWASTRWRRWPAPSWGC